MSDSMQVLVRPEREDRFDLARVLARICVRPPYFSLTDLRSEGAFLLARARAEAPAHRERAPMTGAEIGRHAAIAGSCSLALRQGDDRRRYYLAREALCRFEPNPAPYGTPVDLSASVVELGKRDAVAAIDLSASGMPLAHLDVSYAILQEPTFERLFQARRRPRLTGPSPYGRLIEPAARVGDDLAVTVVDAIPADACIGHFEEHPALPVAALMGQLTYLAGLLAPQPFRVRRGIVRAQDLAWAGERVRFEAQRVASDEADRWRFECTATAGPAGSPGDSSGDSAGDGAGRVVGSMTLWLEASPEVN